MFCCSCGNRRFGIVFLWTVLAVQAVFLLALFIGLVLRQTENVIKSPENVLRPTENDLKSPENVLKSPENVLKQTENVLSASGNVLKTPVVLAEREVYSSFLKIEVQFRYSRCNGINLGQIETDSNNQLILIPLTS
jgi:hypothetical protein